MPDAYDVPGYLELMQRVQEAMSAGRYAEAAPGFERCARMAHACGDVMEMKMSANNAVTAFAHASDPTNALRLATEIVDLLASASAGADRRSEIPGFARHALESLRTQAHFAQADALSAHVAQRMGGAWSDAGAPRLAAFCPSCGAAVKPAEVVRPTPSTVACRYCGASLDRG
jgi:hypothetical protein